jgi:hypothetical protein
MRRREFVTLLGGAAVWPLSARAQQAERVRRVGLLMGIANSSVGQAYEKAFEQELQRLGWTEGRNLEIEARWGEGRIGRFTEIVAEFVRLKVDVIVTTGTPSALLAKEATSIIPIVFATGDPVAVGLVASWRGRAAISPGFRTRIRNRRASALGSCARWSRGYAAWRSWATPRTPPLCKKWPRFGKRRASLGSM